MGKFYSAHLLLSSFPLFFFKKKFQTAPWPHLLHTLPPPSRLLFGATPFSLPGHSHPDLPSSFLSVSSPFLSTLHSLASAPFSPPPSPRSLAPALFGLQCLPPPGIDPLRPLVYQAPFGQTGRMDGLRSTCLAEQRAFVRPMFGNDFRSDLCSAKQDRTKGFCSILFGEQRLFILCSILFDRIVSKEKPVSEKEALG